jgi:hypothetical protein
MSTRTRPIRRGVPMCFTLDPDAEPLLRAMVTNQKAYGLLISELVRKEARERAERPQLLAALRGHQVETAIAQEVDRACGG